MTQRFEDLPLTLTVPEVAEVLRIGRSAAYAAVDAGTLSAFRVGRKLRVSRATLGRMLGEDESEPLGVEPEQKPDPDHLPDEREDERVPGRTSSQAMEVVG